MESSNILKVKYQRKTINVDVSKIEKVNGIMEELFRETKIPVDEQFLTFKGRVLKTTDDVSKIPPGSRLTLTGAKQKADELSAKITFVEDLTPEQRLQILREKGEEIVFGLKNLGNTCYLNATVQCLGRVPELRKALKEFAKKPQPSGANIEYLVDKSLGTTYEELDNANNAVTPVTLVSNIRQLVPYFAENVNGIYKQQDADECLTSIMTCIKEYLRFSPNDGEEHFKNNVLEDLFGIEMTENLKNVEVETEVKKKSNIVWKLCCYIGNKTIELVEGLKEGLKENVDLYSDILKRNTVFIKSQLINRLPPYLIVQFMRFDWTKGNTLSTKKAGKAKILRSVLFSKIIDLYDMCTDETKEILNLGRKIESKLLKDDKNFNIEKVEKKPDQEMIPTGRYQLIAVITHEGRSSDGGHYVGWVHKKDDKWLKYDDDEVSMVKTADVLDLKGGGDWPMAYFCFFKQLEIPFMEIAE